MNDEWKQEILCYGILQVEAHCLYSQLIYGLTSHRTSCTVTHCFTQHDETEHTREVVYTHVTHYCLHTHSEHST